MRKFISGSVSKLYSVFAKIVLLFMGLSLLYYLYVIISGNIVYTILVLFTVTVVSLILYSKKELILNKFYELYIDILMFTYNFIFKASQQDTLSTAVIFLLGNHSDILVEEYKGNIRYAEEMELSNIGEKIESLHTTVESKEKLNKLYITDENGEKGIMFLFKIKEYMGKNRKLTKTNIKLVEKILKNSEDFINEIDYEFEKQYSMRKESDGKYTVVIKWIPKN